MITYILREDIDTGTYHIAAHQDEMPAHWHSEEYPTVEAAKAAHPYEWQEPDADADRDVIAVAEVA